MNFQLPFLVFLPVWLMYSSDCFGGGFSNLIKIKSLKLKRRILYRTETFNSSRCLYKFAWIALDYNDSALIYPYSHQKSCSALKPIGTFSMIDMTTLDKLLALSGAVPSSRETNIFFLADKLNNYHILVIVKFHGFRIEVNLKIYDSLEITKPKDIICYSMVCKKRTKSTTLLPIMFTSPSNNSSDSKHLKNLPDNSKTEIFIYRMTLLAMLLLCLILISVAAYFAMLYKQEKKAFMEFSQTAIQNPALSASSSSANGVLKT